MTTNESKTISVLTTETEELGMFPSPGRVAVKSTDIAVEVLEESLSGTLGRLREIVEALPTGNGIYDIETVSFALAINASGKISLVGTVSAGVDAAITVTLRRQNEKNGR